MHKFGNTTKPFTPPKRYPRRFPERLSLTQSVGLSLIAGALISMPIIAFLPTGKVFGLGWWCPAALILSGIGLFIMGWMSDQSAHRALEKELNRQQPPE